MIYYCHIPKTSGASIEAVLDKHMSTVRYAYSQHPVEQMGEAYCKDFLDRFKHYDLVRGHFAATPLEMFPGVKTYSIVRNPLDRVLSVFKFSQKANSWKKPFKDVLYSFVLNEKPTNASIGFDGRPNIQCDYLTQPLEWFANGIVPSVKKQDVVFSEVLQKIKDGNYVLSTIENRNYLLDDLGRELTKQTGNEIILDSSIKVNENPFRMDIDHIIPEFYEKFYRLNKLDFDLYYYIRGHEKQFNKSLKSSDIII